MTINNIFRYIQIVYSSKALDELCNLNQSDLRQQQQTTTTIIFISSSSSSTSSTRYKNNNLHLPKNDNQQPLTLIDFVDSILIESSRLALQFTVDNDDDHYHHHYRRHHQPSSTSSIRFNMLIDFVNSFLKQQYSYKQD